MIRRAAKTRETLDKDGTAKPAKVWCLLGRKAGDNTQVLALAETLGWPFEEKRILARSWELLPHLLLGPTPMGIDRQASSPLVPPWPDLVISAGRRNEPVARWIRRQAGGGVRLVHVGRPWAPPDCYDLIVSTPQYFLEPAPNILVNPLPMHRFTRGRVDAAAERAAPALAQLPRPFTTVLIGGDSGPFVFTPQKGRHLAEGVNRLVWQTGGSALVTGSPRTSRAVAQAFCDALHVPAQTYWWHERAGANVQENPYPAFLGLADRFVVTGESMSMMAEAASLGRPLYIFDPGDAPGSWWGHAHNFRHKPLSHALAMRLAPVRMRRDISRIQDNLVQGGQARWLNEAPGLIADGEGWTEKMRSDPLVGAHQASERIRALFASAPT
ncbi:ELM1/GtrOC1 family putative glycosyltransferase [uncultured Roseovarius sp.]|uniref:mitochondrial fission ELM1 family protein n=1 Tax=uncultured Roseovarius sp. TaxID=293344 RepID=UPI00260D92D0|nr:ELM1/GtrOC1 family putative glycosyltransferase [uncultured Roseovarius sp.]